MDVRKKIMMWESIRNGISKQTKKKQFRGKESVMEVRKKQIIWKTARNGILRNNMMWERAWNGRLKKEYGVGMGLEEMLNKQ